jgi:hypothetical protein
MQRAAVAFTNPTDVVAVREMRRAKWQPLLIGSGLVSLAAFVAVLWEVESFVSARGELEEKGYSDVHVSFEGPFTFGFSATKGLSTCSGTLRRYPGSSSMGSFCTDTTPHSTIRTRLSNRREVEKNLRTTYTKLGFDQFTCPDIADSDTRATCVVAADNGCSLSISIERTETFDDGSWSAFTVHRSATVWDGETLSADLTDSVIEATKSRHHVGLQVDCGKGPVAFIDGKAQCTLTSRDATPVHTVVTLTETSGGGYAWRTKGL